MIKLRQIAADPYSFFGLIAAISCLALIFALAAQLFYHLEPCILCLYQRAPFAAAIAFSITGMALRDKPKAVMALAALCALAFIINAGIAAYHTGVERHWWDSVVEGCHIPAMDDQSTDWIDKVMTTPAAPCNEIRWADPIFKLTMANYNAALNLALFAFCVFGFLTRRK